MGTFKKVLRIATDDLVPWGVDQFTSYVKATLETKQEDLELERIAKYEKLAKKLDKKNISTDNIPLSKEDLGRKTWPKIHGMAAELPKDADKDQVKETAKNINQLINEYPCSDCREHGRELAKEVELTNANTRDELLIKTYKLHNKVNQRLNKEIFPIEDFRNTYDL